MTALPRLKARVKVNFPARVTAGTAISVEKDSGEYTIAFDVTSLEENTTLTPSNVTDYVVPVYNETTETYTKLPLEDFGSSIGSITPSDGTFIVGDGTDFVGESGATARTSMGVGTGDSPQFTGIELGHATDTTITRVAAGRVAVEGVGLVKGPASAVSTNIPTFSGTTGDLIQDSGKALPSGTVVGTSDSQALTNKTYNGLTITSTTGSLTIAAGKTVTVNNTLTFTGTDSSSVAFGAGGTVLYNGGAAGTPSSITLTNGTGLPTAGIVDSAVTNAKLANSAAYTLKGNFTGSSVAPQDATIGSLTQKASPASTDLVLIQDQAASGALKYATVSSLASAGSVSSIAGNTGAFTLSTGITNSTNDIRLAAKGSFRATKGGTDQTGVASATATQITFSTEAFDTGSYFASNTWTPPAGLVMLMAGVQATGTITSGARIILSIYKNGSTISDANSVCATNVGGASVLTMDRANGTDAYTVYLYIVTSSGTATIGGAASATFFAGSWLAP